jgi:hypothetical protein
MGFASQAFISLKELHISCKPMAFQQKWGVGGETLPVNTFLPVYTIFTCEYSFYL